MAQRGQCAINEVHPEMTKGGLVAPEAADDVQLDPFPPVSYQGLLASHVMYNVQIQDHRTFPVLAPQVPEQRQTKLFCKFERLLFYNMYSILFWKLHVSDCLFMFLIFVLQMFPSVINNIIV